MCACAAPAASQPVAVQVGQNVAPLANSPSLDELRIEPSPEGGSVALEIVVTGHGANGTRLPDRPDSGEVAQRLFYVLISRARVYARG